ncbi:MAG: hypothetical protein DRJ50_09310, partial [Actinobacteria bacterium]
MSQMTDDAEDPATHSARGIVVSPPPSDEEVAAIIAATEALWPKPAIPPSGWTPRNTSWRFSGRWWSRPIAARRD